MRIISHSQDLPFKRGDSLTIISKSKDPNWYKAKRYDGLEGMIPFNYVQRVEDALASKAPPVTVTSNSASSTTHASPVASHKTAAAVDGPRQAVKLQSMP